MRNTETTTRLQNLSGIENPDIHLLPLQSAARTTIATAVLISASVLIGWQFRMPWLKVPIGTFMTSNVAICSLLICVAVLFTTDVSRKFYPLGLVPAILAAVICILNLIEHVTGHHLAIINYAYSRRVGDWDIVTPFGLFAPNTAVALVLLAFAAGLLLERRRPKLSQMMAGTALLLSLIAIIGFILGVHQLYAFRMEYAMTANTALDIFVLSLGVLFAHGNQCWSAHFFRRDIAGTIARRLLLIVFIAVPTLGYLRVYLENAGLVSSRMGTAFFVVSVLAMFTITIVVISKIIHRMDQAQQLAGDRLREAEKLAATGRLAAVLAHEVNNPLAAVTNILYLLANQGSLGSEERRLLAIADGEIKRIAQITRRTLAFYRDPTSPVATDLGELVQSVIEVYQTEIESKLIKCILRVSPTPKARVYPGELRQIVSNLLVNAIDAGEQGSQIAVRVRSVRDWGTLGNAIKIVIADSGNGIPEQFRAKIFEPFFTTKGNKGTGLGLWVTIGLVSNNGGRILFKSRSGARHGTVFCVVLPLRISTGGKIHSAEQRLSPAS